MKKRVTLIILLCLFSLIAFPQNNLRGNNWIIGYQPVVNFSFNLGLQIDTIKNASPTVTPFCLVNSASACISDTVGHLLFFTNGYIIYDSNGYGMQNGLFVNCPQGNILADHNGHASLFDQTSIIIPKKNNQYYVFSTGMSDSVANEYINHHWTEFDILNYSIVDMDSNAGKGKVVEKNIILADHQHYVNCALTAVKHANGKDWWLVKADCINHRYQEFLVKEDTILGPFYQNITDTGDFCAFFSQIYFSQDGKQMASSIYGKIYNNGASNNDYNFNQAEVYDFDRCNGSIIFKHHYIVPYDTTNYPNNDYKSGICFSPNGKLLYMSNTYTIYQIDLEDTNTYNATFIHGPDTTINGFNWYNLMEIGPDSNIYIGYYGGSKSMSYINKPNEKGLACDFVIHGVTQPYTYLLSPPNMPNYGLGADSSKICWPLFISTSLKESTKLLCYPNPASTTLTIELITNKKGLVPIEMYNMVGELVLKTEIQAQTKVQINISSLPKGVYVIRCEGASQKAVVE